MLVNLYTKQHRNSIYEIQHKSRITNKEIYVRLHMSDIADFFVGKYDKFVELAEKRVPRPEGVEYPIWCSISRDNCMKPDEKSIVYCLQVPYEYVIYFSSIKWDYVLNNLYIGKDPEDEKIFNNKLKACGIKNRFSMVNGKYGGYFPDLDQEIIASWDRIFDIDEWDEFKVQANIWEIKEDWIKHIIYPGQDLHEIASDMGDDLEGHRQAREKD